VVASTDGAVVEGAILFHRRACLNCHLIEGYGGRRGPDLTYVADRLNKTDLIIRIVNGGGNMPAYGRTLKPGEIDALVAFLETRRRRVPDLAPEATTPTSERAQ
jgi:ubiquinol-cytochrome c reductase cytochrome b subunit